MGNDMLSQEEIDCLLKGTDVDDSSKNIEEISEVEEDALGEIGNISMGTAATTLSTLLNKKVRITTPQVEITNTAKLSEEYSIPFVAVDVKYKQGLEGSNVLIIAENDVKTITDLMMNKEVDIDRELSELDLSAISEAMNQMMGSSSTSLSEVFGKRIDIEPPKSYYITFDEASEQLEVFQTNNSIIKISFKMEVEDLVNSKLMQLIPIEFGKQTVKDLIGDIDTDTDDEVEEVLEDKEIPANDMHREERNISFASSNSVNANSQTDEINQMPKEQVVVKKPKFETFDSDTQQEQQYSYEKSVDLVGDIPVEITAELGRTTKKIGEILKYGQGTVIELDNLVGEPLNVYANGKYIAKGEVVVIDDNFGIRITSVDNTYDE